MSSVLVRKKHAGSDSFGHVWTNDGDVVEMPYEQAAELVAIPTAGCSIVDTPPELPVSPVDESPPPVDVPEPEEPPAAPDLAAGDGERTDIDEAPAPRRRGRPRKTTFDVEE